ncbi:hypothetical protein [Paraglaciecola sp.]|uniref:hypothetical protein n=1 Tax=Paraglaciecola sp. TaxID=1920173 RepID=UPI003EF4FDF8
MLKIVKNCLKFLAKRSPLISIYLHYLRGRKSGGRRKNIKALISDTPLENDTYAAVWDFTIWPYALGDILNWNICLCCEAINKGLKNIDIYIIVDETRPSPKVQGYISTHNYERFLLDIFPAFYTNPMLNTIKIFKSRNEFEREMINLTCQKTECTPNMYNYAENLQLASMPDKRLAYSGEFKTINEFYKTNNYVPKLKAFKGVETVGTNLKFGFSKDVFFVSLHLRQRKSELGTVDSSASLYRDVEFDHWIAFIEKIGKLYPNVKFLLAGRHEEVDRRILNLPNVIFLKHYGHTLAGELSAIIESDLFIGSNSGPAMMAMLSDVPYLIYQTTAGQQYTAKICDIEVGSPTIQFANENQYIIWGDQDAQTLFTSFEKAYQVLSEKKGIPKEQTTE